ncbi:hypothetical protein PHLGIDRAFT_153899 [Phlebiopsis gigantea 11061_1 CR5-6]|uniref:Uncharacterized protein n=1 Tax=Phlebiopsis gigantea (strain 11061_1 CR5-6) TaxID=745531 RepID=A0A0C3S8J6_PHLG1|nr:hypothetical protein PHLGIDRAFT_153899 [Phlebiopsis gigantea 11061_1 CR5-6]
MANESLIAGEMGGWWARNAGGAGEDELLLLGAPARSARGRPAARQKNEARLASAAGERGVVRGQYGVLYSVRPLEAQATRGEGQRASCVGLPRSQD